MGRRKKPTDTTFPATGAYSAREPTLPGDRNRDQRAESALRLRILGYNYADIARQCGYADKGAAWKAIKRLRDRQRTDDQRAMADLQSERIETAILTVMLAIQDWQPKDKLWAVDRLGPLLKRQADLLGLDAPKQEAQARQMVAVRITSETANAIRGVGVLAGMQELQEGVAE